MKNNHAFLISGTTLAGAVMAANAVNLIFNAYLGRVISSEEFGIIALINTLLYVCGMFYLALGASVVHEVSRLESRAGPESAAGFLSSSTKQVMIISLFASIIWALTVPFTTRFFNIDNPLILYLFTPVFILYPLVAIGRGFLQGRLFFALTGFLILLEPVIKLLSAFFLLNLNLESFIYTSIYISVILTGITAILIAWYYKPKGFKGKYPFPHKFFWAAFLTTISTISFLALDMVLVKHYLSPVEAGQYAILALLGKIIYFLGSLLNIFTISLVSREPDEKKNPYLSFSALFAGSVTLCAIGIIALGFFGEFFIPLLFGNKASSIIPYALPYISAIALFTLGSVVVTYHLARKKYIFPFISIGMAAVLTSGIIIYHQTLTQIVYVLLTVGFIYSVTLLIFHARQNFFTAKIAIKSREQIQEGVL